MIKFLKNLILFPFRKVAKSAAKTHLSPQANRKRIAQDILILAIFVCLRFLSLDFLGLSSRTLAMV